MDQTVRFILSDDLSDLCVKQIQEVLEVNVKTDKRGRFNASANYCLRRAIEFLDSDQRISKTKTVEIEIVRR